MLSQVDLDRMTIEFDPSLNSKGLIALFKHIERTVPHEVTGASGEARREQVYGRAPTEETTWKTFYLRREEILAGATFYLSGSYQEDGFEYTGMRFHSIGGDSLEEHDEEIISLVDEVREATRSYLFERGSQDC